MTITKKTRLLPAPFVGTRITIKLDDPESLDWGINVLSLAGGSSFALIDWGDGTTEQTNGAISPVHTYQSCGTYEVVLSDDIETLCFTTGSSESPFRMYGKRILAIRSRAQNLDSLSTYSLCECDNLTIFDFRHSSLKSLSPRALYKCFNIMGALYLPPSLISLGANSFGNCTGITELHFSKAQEETIKALQGYDKAFGAVNAAVYFDL